MDSDHGRRASSQAWDKLYRGDLFADVRFPDGHAFEDVVTTHRLVMRAGRVACVPDALVHYRERKGHLQAALRREPRGLLASVPTALRGAGGDLGGVSPCLRAWVSQRDFEDLVLVGVVFRRREGGEPRTR